MIDMSKVNNYNSYSVINEWIKDIECETKKEVYSNKREVPLDIQGILKDISEYTYTKQDQEAVDPNLVQDLKEQLEVKEEDIYELYAKGVDLEALTVNEILSQTSKQKAKDMQSSTIESKTIDKKIEAIKKQNQSMYLNALNISGAITINSLYESGFKGEIKKGISQYTKADVDQVLSMNGLQINESNEWAANLLMMYDIGVSQTNILKLQGIRSAISVLDSSGNYSGDEELIKHGQVQYQPEYVERITDELGMVTDEHIERLIEEGKEINIGELRESIHKPVQEALDERQEFKGDKQDEQSEQVHDVKRQILQITKKLTVEAAQRISETMPLESSSLQAVVEALAQMEHEMAVSALEQVNLPVTQENLSAITDTMNVVEQIGQHFMPTVQIEIATREQASLNEVSTVLAAYHDNETPVELRFGESIETVENQITHLLESQDIEVTQNNIDAAKALITNQLEVTPQEIQNIQDIVLKINTFLEEITPVQVASMIKEGFNPYHTSINEILNWMSEKKIEGLKTSVAEAIISLETSGQINEEQKEGMIGLYRIMQAVSKQKEQVIGYLYRNELPMTVENLQRASQYVKRKNPMKVVIDDHFGEIENRIEPQNKASKMIQNSIEASSKTLDVIKVLENMQLPITKENIYSAQKISALLYPYIKEQFKNTIGKFEGLNSLPESFLEKVQIAQNASSELIESMLEQEIPLTLSNIYWMEKMNYNPGVYSTLLNEKGLLKEGLPKDLEELEEVLQEIELKVNNYKEEATLDGQWKEYRDYKQLQEIVQFQRQRIENEGLYQIPFMINGEHRLVNLYVQEDQKNSSMDDDMHLKAVISYQTKSIGMVKAYIEIHGDHLGYKIEAENLKDTEQLKKHVDSLLTGLTAIGYSVNYSSFEYQEILQENSDITHKYNESQFEQII